MFSALPTFYTCSLQLPPTVLRQIDKYRKHCMWSGRYINRKSGCLAAWDIACRTKEEEGLDVINMKNLNTTLLLKFLDKFYNQADIPWVKFTWVKLYNNNDTPAHVRRPIGSFWWKDISKLIDKFLQMTHCQPNRGNSLIFGQTIGCLQPSRTHTLSSTQSLFSFHPKTFHPPSHQMFRHMYGVLNVDKKTNLHSLHGNRETNLLKLISP
jgi:hypothetical protein